MISARARHSLRQLTRRRGRTVLTIVTIAVAGVAAAQEKVPPPSNELPPSPLRELRSGYSPTERTPARAD